MEVGNKVEVSDGNSIWFGLKGHILNICKDEVIVKFNMVTASFEKDKLHEVKK